MKANMEMYLVGIVGIVAAVGMLMLMTGGALSSSDLTGEAFIMKKLDRDRLQFEEDLEEKLGGLISSGADDKQMESGFVGADGATYCSDADEDAGNACKKCCYKEQCVDCDFD